MLVCSLAASPPKSPAGGSCREGRHGQLLAQARLDPARARCHLCHLSTALLAAGVSPLCQDPVLSLQDAAVSVVPAGNPVGTARLLPPLQLFGVCPCCSAALCQSEEGTGEMLSKAQGSQTPKCWLSWYSKYSIISGTVRDFQMRAPFPLIDNGLETTGSSPVIFHNVNCPDVGNTALRALEILSAGAQGIPPTTRLSQARWSHSRTHFD